MDRDTGKNLLTQEKKSVEKKEQVISVRDNDGYLDLRIQKKFLLENSTFDIQKLILAALSPIFLNKNKQAPAPAKRKQSTIFPHVAFFIEFMPHYTGGRYSMFLQALILSHYTRVTVVSTHKPPFYDDFKDYYNDNFSMAYSNDWLMHQRENPYDLIFGIPNICGQFAHAYAKKWKLKLYLMMFETPNWIRQFREGIDSTEDFWSSYKKSLLEADKIITPSVESKKWLQDWDPEFRNKTVEVLYPNFNQLTADKVMKEAGIRHYDRKSVVFLSRMADFKKPITLFEKIPDDVDIHIIGKIWSETRTVIDKVKKDNWIIHEQISDEEKFRIIRNSDLLIFPTKFEGAGMPPMEAFYFGIPVITYDLPVLRELYGNLPVYIPIGDEGAFLQAIMEALGKDGSHQDFARSKQYANKSYASVRKTAERMLELFEIPKVTAGVIVGDGYDYLEYAVNSLFPYLWEVVIAHGFVDGYKNTNDAEFDEVESALTRLLFKDTIGKIRYGKGKAWKDKIEMQNKIAENVTGEFYLKLDSDEVWKPETFQLAIQEFVDDPDLTILKMPFFHFWLSFKNIAVDAGGKWGTKHPRIWRWDKSFRHETSFNHFVNTQNAIHIPVISPDFKEKEFGGDRIYHFGWCRKLGKMLIKIRYYKLRGIEKFVTDTVSEWKELSDATMVTQDVRSWAEPFDGILPKILEDHPYKNIKDVRNL